MKTCIYTMVSGNYQWYIPLFAYRCQEEYPECDVIIEVHGDCFLPKKYRSGVVENLEYENVCKANTNSLRFVLEDKLSEYDYTLLTDVDMMMFREKRPFYTQKREWMKRNKNDFYANCMADNRVPGVHFVSKKWWKATRTSRVNKLCHLRRNFGKVVKEYDEVMLGEIIKESHLPAPATAWKFSYHGVHLGRFRGNMRQLRSNALAANELTWIRNMVEDRKFNKLVRDCGERAPWVRRVFEYYGGHF